MSGGKRKNEDVSDTMALVQAACKVLAITARPLAHFRHRRQPVRSAMSCGQTPCQWSRRRHVRISGEYRLRSEDRSGVCDRTRRRRRRRRRSRGDEIVVNLVKIRFLAYRPVFSLRHVFSAVSKTKKEN
jgi:hypothetical protein